MKHLQKDFDTTQVQRVIGCLDVLSSYFIFVYLLNQPQQSESLQKDVELAKLQDLYSESYSLAKALQVSHESLELSLL